MLFLTPFVTTNALIVNTHRNIIAPRWPVRHLRYVVFLHNFMIAQ